MDAEHAQEAAPVRHRLVVAGQVQGVGFRPYLYRLALAHELTGCTRNAPEGVVVEVQGPPDAVQAFCRELVPHAPPLARITACHGEAVAIEAGETTFRILTSTGGEGHAVLVSPDVATCPDCLKELRNPDDPRHLYPFINCTNCGPRYTITQDIPYDRPATTMACFPLCPDCQREYNDPADRRFHAQPNACPQCGPEVWLQDHAQHRLAIGDAAMQAAAQALVAGQLVAMKGLGGFHLVCDAHNRTAIMTLRERKHRPHKPLAVMAADVDAAAQFVTITATEAALIAGIERPIVLCRLREEAGLPHALAPGLDTLGVMSPYTPMQHVLLQHVQALSPSGAPPLLVMTSGNRGGEPICLGNREALEALADMADVFLLHNRDILIRVDDSVLRVPPDDPYPVPEVLPEVSCDAAAPPPESPPRRLQFLRRARGFTPAPMQLAHDGPCVLATGPELKATLCCTKGDQAFVSQHLGDLENVETFQFFEEMAAHLPKLLRVTPLAIVHDLHPDFLSTRWAKETAAARGIPAMALQHHAAHAFSVLAEHAFAGRALVLALDGTGLGLPAEDAGTEDAAPHIPIWGGEAILADTTTGHWERLGHLRPVPLPGGEAAAREPWRMAMSFGHVLGMTGESLGLHLPADLHPAAAFLPQLLQSGINAPLTSSCGRLFDALAGLLGLCHRATYEGQAAVLLEQSQDHTVDPTSGYGSPLMQEATTWQLDTHALFATAVDEHRTAIPPGVIARRVHLGLIQGLADLATILCTAHGLTHVGLSGGCLLNQTLHTELPQALAARGLTPLLHRQLPPGDACVSLGQAAWGQIMMWNQ